MTFSLPDSWVWDFWTAVDDDTTHLFYLHAPKSLGDPDLRHRNAAIGHATSEDLVTWTDQEHITQNKLAGVYRLLDAVADYSGFWPREKGNLV